jgi:hypothetical protein
LKKPHLLLNNFNRFAIILSSESAVILDSKITTACHDSQVYLEQLQNVIDTHGINIEKSIADRAYGSGEILQSLINIPEAFQRDPMDFGVRLDPENLSRLKIHSNSL